MSMGKALKAITDKAAEEITAASRGKIVVTWLLLCGIGVAILYAAQRLDQHSEIFQRQMAPITGFGNLMMKPVMDPSTGYETPQIVTWIQQLQQGHQVMIRVDAKLDQQAVELKKIQDLQERIVQLLEQQQAARRK